MRKKDLENLVKLQSEKIDKLDKRLTPKPKLPAVRFLGVTHVNDRQILIDVQNIHNGYTQERKLAEGPSTIVLYELEGVIQTKAIEGTWNLGELNTVKGVRF